MDIIDYDKLRLHFEEFSLILPRNVIEKFQMNKVEQLIEKKYDPEDIYDIYIVINRGLAEELWQKDISKNIVEASQYENITECINSNSIYDISIYKDGEIKTYSPVWSYTEFQNEYERIGITADKILIRIKEI